MRKARTYPRRGLHGELVHNIGLKILRGELEPGAFLPNEDHLSTELDVSRNVVREAIKVLAAKGLVESRPKTGTRVQSRHDWNLLDPDVLAWRIEAGPDDIFLEEMFAVRRLIEPEAARLAAERATAGDVAELGRALGEMEDAVDDLDAYVAADVRFHSEIYRASHNELLEYIGEMLRGANRLSFTLTTRLPGASVAALPLHAAVHEAIAARAGEAAVTAMLALLDRSAALYAETKSSSDMERNVKRAGSG